MFADERQEQAFTVKGGLLWFHHVLIASVEVSGGHQVRCHVGLDVPGPDAIRSVGQIVFA